MIATRPSTFTANTNQSTQALIRGCVHCHHWDGIASSQNVGAISKNMNSLIFKAVQDFIAQSGCFAME